MTPPPPPPGHAPLPGPTPRTRASGRPGAYDRSFEELADMLDAEPAFRARQVWDGLYRRAVRPEEMTELPQGLRARLGEELPPGLGEAARRTADGGDTVKWLWALADGRQVESVLMGYPDRVTVCVSTQAGCAMGCTFCATGQGGYQRHLTTGEIVEQVVAAIRAARPRRLTNVVFMGMGEPLANYDRVWSAVERIHGDLGISARRLTLSTVGVVPGIRRLATASLPVNLALSLHAANDGLRDRLVPLNRRYPLAVLAEACGQYVAATGRRLSIEWAMIDGTNDSHRDMVELADFARPMGAHVNLIPLNPTPGYPVRGTPRRRVLAAQEELGVLGVNATVRATRGVEIDAACGQLAATAAAAPDATAASAPDAPTPVRMRSVHSSPR